MRAVARSGEETANVAIAVSLCHTSPSRVPKQRRSRSAPLQAPASHCLRAFALSERREINNRHHRDRGRARSCGEVCSIAAVTPPYRHQGGDGEETGAKGYAMGHEAAHPGGRASASFTAAVRVPELTGLV